MFVTDSRGGGLLELNASEKAGVSPLNHLGRGFFEKQVMDHVKAATIEKINFASIMGGSFSRNANDQLLYFLDDLRSPKTSGVIQLQHSRFSVDIDRKTVEIAADYPHLCVVNASRVHQSLYNNKAILAEVAQDAGVESMPRTRNYLRDARHIDDMIGRVVEDFKDRDTVVIKPVTECQGKGVIVAPYRLAGDYLAYAMDRYRWRNNPGVDAYAASYWRASSSPLFQVQDYCPTEPLRYRGRDWSSTLRIGWLAMVGENRDGTRVVEVTPHGAFHKLPRAPIARDGMPNQNSTVSYSYAHNGFESITHWFCKVARLRRDFYVINDNDALQQLALPVQKDLEKIFEFVDPLDLPALHKHFASSNDPVRNHLAHSLARAYDITVPRQRGRVPLPQTGLEQADVQGVQIA